MKPKFYIFLDIDGVMYDWNVIKSNNISFSGVIDKFSEQSVNALNYLTKQLTIDYIPVIVISSTWRHDMYRTIKTLKSNGVNLDLKNIRSTPITNTPDKRGEEILSFLSAVKDKQNFVIIDDEMFDYEKHFTKDKIIKTNINNDCLKVDKVNTFFNKNDLSYLIDGDKQKQNFYELKKTKFR